MSEFTRKDACHFINAIPALQSLLYDINLLPELPLSSAQEREMMLIVAHWREAEYQHRKGVEYAENMFDALYRLRKWDHLDTAADGPYWKLVIDAALAKNPAGAAPASSGRDTPAAERPGHAPASAGPGCMACNGGVPLMNWPSPCPRCGREKNSSSGSFTNPKEK